MAAQQALHMRVQSCLMEQQHHMNMGLTAEHVPAEIFAGCSCRGGQSWNIQAHAHAADQGGGAVEDCGCGWQPGNRHSSCHPELSPEPGVQHLPHLHGEWQCQADLGGACLVATPLTCIFHDRHMRSSALDSTQSCASGQSLDLQSWSTRVYATWQTVKHLPDSVKVRMHDCTMHQDLDLCQVGARLSAMKQRHNVLQDFCLHI